MTKLMWIVDTQNFQGYAQTHVSVEDDGTATVAYSGRLYNNGGPNLSPEQYLALPGHEHLSLIDDAELDRLVAEHNWTTYLNQPVQEITRETFWEMLEVLPPMNWVGGDGFERFNMVERMTGSITSQYARLGDRYFTKYVDLTKPETNMTAASLAGL